jgi:uncharacterized protein (DUF433 family)
MEPLDRITFDPLVMGGKPCIRGMRIRVTDVLELLAAGMTPSEIMDEHPDLETEDIRACILYSIQQVDHPVVITHT